MAAADCSGDRDDEHRVAPLHGRHGRCRLQQRPVNVVGGHGECGALRCQPEDVDHYRRPDAPSRPSADLATPINTDLARHLHGDGQRRLGFRRCRRRKTSTRHDSTGNTGGNVLKGDLVLSIGGSTGREVFNFQQDASGQPARRGHQPRHRRDGRGRLATTRRPLDLNSTAYGSTGIVDTEVISEGAGGEFEASLTGASAPKARTSWPPSTA